jgi:hypothetical protein
MTFEYSIPDHSNGTLVLYDLAGRILNSYTLIEGLNNLLKISEDQLQGGIYIYRIIVNGEIKKNERIIIVK